MNERIRQELFNNSDKEYGNFSSALIPGAKQLIGVRLPALRQLAKDIVKCKDNDWKKLVREDEPDFFFEETMLRGMIVGYGCSKENDIKDVLKWLDYFIPYIDNWSVCDSFCVSLTGLSLDYDKSLEHIERYIYSSKEFEVRAGLILLLNQFLKLDNNEKKITRLRSVSVKDIKSDNDANGKYIKYTISVLNRPFTQGYYAMMAAAWLTAECFVSYPYQTFLHLSDNRMDNITFNKALAKICESRIPDAEVKNIIRSIKRK